MDRRKRAFGLGSLTGQLAQVPAVRCRIHCDQLGQQSAYIDGCEAVSAKQLAGLG